MTRVHFQNRNFIEVNNEFIAVQKPKKAPAKKNKSYLETLEYHLSDAMKKHERYTAEGNTLLAGYMEKNISEYNAKIAALTA